MPADWREAYVIAIYKKGKNAVKFFWVGTVRREDIEEVIEATIDNKRKNSFPCRVIDMRNALPESVVNCETLKFEKILDEFWSDREQI